MNRRSLENYYWLLKKLKYLFFDDPEGSRSHSVIILDVEYIVSGAEYGA